MKFIFLNLLCSLAMAQGWNSEDLWPKDEKVEAKLISALRSIGNLEYTEMNDLILGMGTGNDLALKKLMIPLVKRQQQQNPFERPFFTMAFPNPNELDSLVKQNPNSDKFPKISTKNLPRYLKEKIMPILKFNNLGNEVEGERELTAIEVFALLSNQTLSGKHSSPLPSGHPDNLFLQFDDWLALRDWLIPLVYGYSDKIKELHAAAEKEKSSSGAEWRGRFGQSNRTDTPTSH